MNEFYSMYKHEEFVEGGRAVIHYHYDDVAQEYKETINVWKKIGNRYIANCSFCGSRFELKQ